MKPCDCCGSFDGGFGGSFPSTGFFSGAGAGGFFAAAGLPWSSFTFTASLSDRVTSMWCGKSGSVNTVRVASRPAESGGFYQPKRPLVFARAVHQLEKDVAALGIFFLDGAATIDAQEPHAGRPDFRHSVRQHGRIFRHGGRGQARGQKHKQRCDALPVFHRPPVVVFTAPLSSITRFDSMTTARSDRWPPGKNQSARKPTATYQMN